MLDGEAQHGNAPPTTSAIWNLQDPMYAQSMHTLWTLRSHGMDSELLQTVYRAVIIAKLLYASSARWGFTTASDRQRLEASLRRAQRSGLYSTDKPTLTQLAEDADNTLFRTIIYSEPHVLVLHSLLPERTKCTHNLRSRTHNFKLSSQHDDHNFIHKMLFVNYTDISCSL